MDAELLTAIRTAAVTGVATNHLARLDSRTAAFVGCGNQTRKQIEAVTAVRDIEAIFLYDLDPERAESSNTVSSTSACRAGGAFL